jgi:hypothetical protein
VAKDEDLDLPVALVAGGRQTKDGTQHHVEEGEEHCWILEKRWSDGESGFGTPHAAPAIR